MTSQAAAGNDHPTYKALALYSGKDLNWSARWKIRHHLRGCVQCQQALESLQAATLELRREADLQTLTGYEAIADWARLEREMMGNIGVGVAAARCIDHVGHRRIGWARVGIGVGMALLFALSWETHIPREQTEHLWTSLRQWAGLRSPDSNTTILRSSPDGVAVGAQGSTLTMWHPRSAVVSVSSGTRMDARYIDTETGQVTIASVYGQ